MATSATGKVNRLYTDRQRCFIRLDYNSSTTGQSTPVPANGYFQLQRSHENYSSLYSLALAAAVNDLELTVRVVGNAIVANQATSVEYLVVNW